MAAGADSIDDLDVIRHGGMPRLFAGVYAPSTLGSFPRSFTHGHTRQLQAVARRFLVDLAGRTPVLAGAAEMTYVDIDSLLRRVYGKRKQGASFGHTKVGGYAVRLRGLSPLAATISTPIAAPVVAGMRLRKGSAGSARRAASLLTEALTTARAAGATGTALVRADSAFYAGAVISAARRGGTRFSVTYKQIRQRVPRRYSAPSVSALGALPVASPYQRARVCGVNTRLPTFRAGAADQAHAAYTPDTTWPVNGLPPGSSRELEISPVSMSLPG